MRSKRQDSGGMERRSFLSLSGGVLAGSMVLRGGLAQAWGRDKNSQSAGPVVSTTAGKVRGILINKVNAFKGISYGASTAGAARFMPPAKPKSWGGVREAVELGERSPQAGLDIMYRLFPELERNEPEGEDCLRVNVWSNGVDSRQQRPVMVWLHGGGFATGSGGFIVYDGANLARKEDVVVVTVNHRLNAFGYLYLAELGGEKYAHSSNVGMLDIIAALEWVRDNIANFGGDPGKVTIFGQSGGGGKVSTLLAMPAAKGLFHRAIVESGSRLRATPASEATAAAQAFMAKLGVKTVDELQQLPMEQLREAVSAPPPGGPGNGPGSRRGFNPMALGPVVDDHTLPTHPFDPVAPAISAHVPLLVGSNQTEVTFFPGIALDPIDDVQLRQRVKQTLHVDDAGAEKLIAVYKKAYPQSSKLDIALIMASDAGVRAAAHTQADRKAELAKAPVYVYYFTWRSPVREGKLRSFHTLEIPFVIQNVDEARAMTGEGKDRYALADRMSGAWAAFARSGDPNHQGLAHWPKYETKTRATMIFDDECKAVNDPDHDERTALSSIRPEQS